MVNQNPYKKFEQFIETFTNADLHGQKFKSKISATFRGANLSGVRLKGLYYLCDFSDADLSDADIDASFVNCLFIGTNFSHVNVKESLLCIHSTFINVPFDQASIDDIEIVGCYLEGGDFSGITVGDYFRTPDDLGDYEEFHTSLDSNIINCNFAGLTYAILIWSGCA